MAKFYCKYCGQEFGNVRTLTSAYCMRHPDGPNKGKHTLYEGSEKSKYTCKFCGTQFNNLRSLTSAYCLRHPDGANKGRHSPAL